MSGFPSPSTSAISTLFVHSAVSPIVSAVASTHRSRGSFSDAVHSGRLRGAGLGAGSWTKAGSKNRIRASVTRSSGTHAIIGGPDHGFRDAETLSNPVV